MFEMLTVTIWAAQSNRSSHRRCYVKKGVLRNFANFTGKQLLWSLFLIKFQAFENRYRNSLYAQRKLTTYSQRRKVRQKSETQRLRDSETRVREAQRERERQRERKVSNHQQLLFDTYTIRSSRPKVFCDKGVLRNFATFTGKHLRQSLFNKVAGLILRNF